MREGGVADSLFSFVKGSAVGWRLRWIGDGGDGVSDLAVSVRARLRVLDSEAAGAVVPAQAICGKRQVWVFSFMNS